MWRDIIIDILIKIRKEDLFDAIEINKAFKELRLTLKSVYNYIHNKTIVCKRCGASKIENTKCEYCGQ